MPASAQVRFGLVEQQGVAYAKTVAEAMDLKLDMDNPADREKLRRAVLDLVPREKNAKAKMVADEIRAPATETHWSAVADAARSADKQAGDFKQP